jgi:DNA-binding YbaB/EbfC family protein
MGLFGQMGDMYKMQKQAKKIKKELSTIHVFAEEGGVKVIVNGSQELIAVEFLDETLLAPENKDKISKYIKSAHERAHKKSQQISAEKMKVLMGDGGGFPGMN